MKKTMLFVCLLVGSMLLSINVMAGQRPVKPVSIARLEMSQSEQQSVILHYANNVRTAVSGTDTIHLETAYEIDDINAFYYELEGKAYYSFRIWNYDDESPELRMEVKAASKTQIQGEQELDLPFCYIQFKNGENVVDKKNVAKGLFWLKYTGLDGDGFYTYDILAYVKTTDGQNYIYRANMPVYAYDKDHLDEYDMPTFIDLEDVEDPAVVEPAIPQDEDPTSIDAILGSHATHTKYYINGQLFIRRGNELFNAQGARVE